jgi:hypothetical protein
LNRQTQLMNEIMVSGTKSLQVTEVIGPTVLHFTNMVNLNPTITRTSLSRLRVDKSAAALISEMDRMLLLIC